MNEIIHFKNKKDQKKFCDVTKNKFDLKKFFNANYRKPLKSRLDLYTIRIHDKYRLIYKIINRIIYVIHFNNRDKVYKKINF